MIIEILIALLLGVALGTITGKANWELREKQQK